MICDALKFQIGFNIEISLLCISNGVLKNFGFSFGLKPTELGVLLLTTTTIIIIIIIIIIMIIIIIIIIITIFVVTVTLIEFGPGPND